MQKEELLKYLYEDSEEAKRCRSISISNGHTFVSDLGHGNPNADLFFVGEAPGKEEDKTGIPFVGKAGEKVNRNLNDIGLDRRDVWFGNVVRYRPTTNNGSRNRKPAPSEIDACLPLLLKEIEIVDPEVVIPLGLTALDALTDQHNIMNRSAGKMKQFGDRLIFPMYHPASSIYRPQLKEKIKDDFQKLKEYFGEISS